MKDKKTFFSEWLEKLQQESWQLELLISGFAIYGLFELKEYLEEVLFQLHSFESIGVVFFVFILTSVYASVSIFIINLIFHVLVRAIWIGAIGLRYVSGDIQYEKLDYNDRFKNYFQKKIGSFDNYIEKLERLSSILFSFTFLLFFMFTSFIIFLLEVVGIMAILAYIFGTLNMNGGGFSMNVENAFGAILFWIVLFLLFGFGLLVLLDFIFLGRLKKIKQRHFSWFYFKVYRFYSFITLSFLWRPILLNFLDEKYTRRFLILSIPYIIIVGIILPEAEMNKDEFYPAFGGSFERKSFSNITDSYSYNQLFYDDERNKEKLVDKVKVNALSIPSKFVEGNIFQVFIKSHGKDKLLINQIDSKLEPLKNDGVTAFFKSNHYLTDKFDELEEKVDNEIESEKVRLKKANTYESDSFRTYKANKIKEFKAIKNAHYETNIIAIKDALQNSFELWIDENKIESSKIECDFYQYQASESGLLCFFPIDSLSLGRHYLSLERCIMTREGNRVDTIKRKIPFIYKGK